MSTHRTLYCALIPVTDTASGSALLLPNAAIAETLTKEAMTAVSGALPGVVGVVRYNDREMPVISIEALNGAVEPATPRSRIVVLHPLDEARENTGLALLASGYPHLVAVTAELLADLPLTEQDRLVAAAARVRVGNTQALIPDLDRLLSIAAAFHELRDAAPT